MKQMIRIIRKVDVEKQYEQLLRLELDYELTSLYDAMQRNHADNQVKAKKRLTEIQKELDSLQAYA